MSHICVYCFLVCDISMQAISYTLLHTRVYCLLACNISMQNIHFLYIVTHLCLLLNLRHFYAEHTFPVHCYTHVSTSQPTTFLCRTYISCTLLHTCVYFLTCDISMQNIHFLYIATHPCDISMQNISYTLSHILDLLLLHICLRPVFFSVSSEVLK